MKVLWFYQPEKATMWDDYALRALNSELHANHPSKVETAKEAEAFLLDFERLYAQNSAEISRVRKYIEGNGGISYAYDRRVLDKALWLLGAKDERIIQMMLRMKADPLNRAVMEHFFPQLQD